MKKLGKKFFIPNIFYIFTTRKIKKMKKIQYPNLPYERITLNNKEYVVGDTDSGSVSLYEPEDTDFDNDPIWIDYLKYLQLGKLHINIQERKVQMTEKGEFPSVFFY